MPLVSDLYVVVGVFFVYGLFIGSMGTVANVLMMYIWGTEPFIQGLHLFFGTGALIVPLITLPFLLKIEDHDRIGNQSTQDIHPQELKLIYPYSFAAASCAVTSIFFLILYILYPKIEG